MITVLKERPAAIYDVVKQDDVLVGDSFTYGLDKDNRPIVRQVVEVIEQRKERGNYADESKRRMWAKVKAIIQ